jgi:Lon protease-like protein
MNERSYGTYRRQNQQQRMQSTMDMPLFPLGVVLFPGMMLPLHIFEPRYREMINRCLDEELPFGVVLINQGTEAGAPAEPHPIGTAARITKVERHPDGRMDIMAVGTRRFRIEELNYSRSYLSAEVSHFPVVNGDTRLATEQAQRVRPKLYEYVDLLSSAAGIRLHLDRMPEDPTNLAFLTAIAMQVRSEDKQRMLSLSGVPEILDMANYLLGRELQLLRYMIDTQPVVDALTFGPTGSLFEN